jgi:hypothetical protein
MASEVYSFTMNNPLPNSLLKATRVTHSTPRPKSRRWREAVNSGDVANKHSQLPKYGSTYQMDSKPPDRPRLISACFAGEQVLGAERNVEPVEPAMECFSARQGHRGFLEKPENIFASADPALAGSKRHPHASDFPSIKNIVELPSAEKRQPERQTPERIREFVRDSLAHGQRTIIGRCVMANADAYQTERANDQPDNGFQCQPQQGSVGSRNNSESSLDQSEHITDKDWTKRPNGVEGAENLYDSTYPSSVEDCRARGKVESPVRVCDYGYEGLPVDHVKYDSRARQAYRQRVSSLPRRNVINNEHAALENGRRQQPAQEKIVETPRLNTPNRKGLTVAEYNKLRQDEYMYKSTAGQLPVVDPLLDDEDSLLASTIINSERKESEPFKQLASGSLEEETRLHPFDAAEANSIRALRLLAQQHQKLEEMQREMARKDLDLADAQRDVVSIRSEANRMQEAAVLLCERLLSQRLQAEDVVRVEAERNGLLQTQISKLREENALLKDHLTKAKLAVARSIAAGGELPLAEETRRSPCSPDSRSMSSPGRPKPELQNVPAGYALIDVLQTEVKVLKAQILESQAAYQQLVETENSKITDLRKRLASAVAENKVAGKTKMSFVCPEEGRSMKGIADELQKEIIEIKRHADLAAKEREIGEKELQAHFKNFISWQKSTVRQHQDEAQTCSTEDETTRLRSQSVELMRKLNKTRAKQGTSEIHNAQTMQANERQHAPTSSPRVHSDVGKKTPTESRMGLVASEKQIGLPGRDDPEGDYPLRQHHTDLRKDSSYTRAKDAPVIVNGLGEPSNILDNQEE